MFSIFMTAVNAVFPIILLIMVGYVLKRVGFFKQDFLKVGNQLVFKVCLPALLFINIYDKMDSFADIPWDVVLYSVAIIAVIFCLGLITALLTTKDSKRKGVILQCVFRSNFAIIGLALVESLAKDSPLAVTTAGIMSAFSIPIFNILAVIALSVFVQEEGGMPKGEQIKKVLKGIATNPLILGVLAGLLAVGIREAEKAIFGKVVFSLARDLTFLHTTLTYLKNIASPFALIVLGGQFEFSAVKGMTKEIIVGTLWRVVVAPLLGVGVALLLGYYTPLLHFDYAYYPTLIALFGTPVAVSSAIMAGAMHNDDQLATQYVVWTSLCSIVTLFVFVMLVILAGQYGLIPSYTA